MSKKVKHLPVIGVGPLYVVPIVIVTVVSIILTIIGIIPFTGIAFKRLFHIAGIFFIAAGIYLWYAAVIASRIGMKIEKNTLVTDGIYAHVRNPIYSAFLFICSGVLFICGNVYLFIEPLLFWLYLTLFMKLTEEKWLLDRYGKEFEDYCKRVNCCIPSVWRKV